ncbi:MAG: hypothetical protein DRJ03_19085 [Chloroflexi bacterium]|nr:MAG: hypothetical protein DRJ03_19085 [Chloroflexota bacterium]
MSEVPTEYTDAINSLKAFRQKILTDLVGGRLKAKLDASHYSMEKYNEILDRLTITPYLFSNVRRKALALKLGTYNVGEGQIAQARNVYALGKVEYPMQLTPEVSPRLLPQVDIYQYDLPTDVSLLQKTNIEMWNKFFVIVADNGTFEETPDIEDASYDYYYLYPQGIAWVEMTLTNQLTGYGSWKYARGEVVEMQRWLHLKGETTAELYAIEVWREGEAYSDTERVGTFQYAVTIPSTTAQEEPVKLNCLGAWLDTSNQGLWALHTGTGVGDYFCKYAEIDTFPVFDWLSKLNYDLTIKVNDPSMGTTSPAPDTYTLKALTEVTITASPNSGYTVDKVTVDGVEVFVSEVDNWKLILRVRKDTEVIYWFKPA